MTRYFFFLVTSKYRSIDNFLQELYIELYVEYFIYRNKQSIEITLFKDN